MRLLQLTEDGVVSLAPNEFFGVNIPDYAIMSHTWGDQELSFQEISQGNGREKTGYQKLLMFGQQALNDGLLYFWADTCCIDARSSAELSEAINKSFLWFKGAKRCYVYLSDVILADRDPNCLEAQQMFRSCQWFKRSWTLQELVAPLDVKFYSADGVQIGDKTSMLYVLQQMTGIPGEVLKGGDLSTFDVDQRMSWAEFRHAKRPEDEVYCLLGILDINIPLLYGEGKQNAKARLMRQIGDTSHRYEIPSRIDIEQAFKRAETVRRSIASDHKPSVPPYYRQLTENKFRVLTLNPGQQGSIITGYIEEANLKDPPLYHALSYVWGEEPVIHKVVINNEITSIRPNLYHALERIRALQSVQVRIWVDSLCINQESTSERSEQVQQMAQIYSKAGAVFIWLGEEDWTSRLAIDFVKEIFEENFRWQHNWWEDYGFTALSRLLERSWFRRVWVLQEAALATSSNIQCGDRQVHMTRFLQVIAHIRSRTWEYHRLHENARLQGDTLSTFRDSSPAVRMLSLIESALERSQDGSVTRTTMSLEALVHLSTFSETSNKRDTVYALLNLANDTSSQATSDQAVIIHPDYDKSILDVYADFVMHCIDRSKSLDIVIRPWAPPVSFERQSTQNGGLIGPEARKLPSWIVSRDNLANGNPSWQSRSRIHGNPLVGNSRSQIYRAHLKTAPRVSRSSAVADLLKVEGILLAKISKRSSRMADGIVTKECIDILGKISHDEDSGGFELPDAVWRTLCADSDGKGNRADGRGHRRSMIKLLQYLTRDDTIQTPGNILNYMPSIDVEDLLEAKFPPEVNAFLVAVRDIVWNRRTFQSSITRFIKDPLIGLVPRNARVGDHVCILYGCSVPVVLRQEHDPGGSTYWRLIGDAYVHGIMDGEALQGVSEDRLRAVETVFRLR